MSHGTGIRNASVVAVILERDGKMCPWLYLEFMHLQHKSRAMDD